MKLAIVLLLAGTVFGSAVCADPCVTASYFPLSIGDYRLEFTLWNDYDNGSCWGLMLTRDTEISDLAAPDGWYSGLTPRNVYWETGFSSEYRVPPGGSLTGFAATFGDLPNEVYYGVKASEHGTSGTLVPVPIPEPSSFAFLSLALAGVGVGRLRRRR